jgi:glycosyltransferase involved in cell wall biosynthesis
LTIIHIITGLNGGGAEGVLYRLCIYDKNHHHIVISMMDEGKYGARLRQAGIAVHCLGMNQGSVSLNGILKLWRLLRCERPFVVQTWMYHADLIGGIVARLAGVKNICWGIRHSNLEAGLSKRSTIYIARLCGMISNIVPRKIVCCAYQASKIHVKLGYVKEKMIIIGNGYDLQIFQPDEESRSQLRADWGVACTVPLLGMVGRFNPQKDHENLITSLALLKQKGLNFSLVLIGTGMSAANTELANWVNIHNMHEQIQLLGQRNDIPAVMNALDIHVLSSAFGEGFPNVLSEAMACGTPCVTTDVGDASLIVGDTGWVVPSKNVRALAKAIEIALSEFENPKLWQKRQAVCRLRIASTYSLETMVKKYHQAWGKASNKELKANL